MIRLVRWATLTGAVMALLTAFLGGLGGLGVEDLDRAAEALRQRKPDAAMRLATRALTFGGLAVGEKARAHALRARAARALRQERLAGREIDAAIALAPDAASPRFLRGEWLRLAGDCHQAAQDYATGLALVGNATAGLTTHLLHAAQAQVCRGDAAEAARLLEQALALSRDEAETLFAKSLLLELRGDLPGAVRAMEQAWTMRLARQGLTPFALSDQGDDWLRRLTKLEMDSGLDPVEVMERLEQLR